MLSAIHGKAFAGDTGYIMDFKGKYISAMITNPARFEDELYTYDTRTLILVL